MRDRRPDAREGHLDVGGYESHGSLGTGPPKAQFGRPVPKNHRTPAGFARSRPWAEAEDSARASVEIRVPLPAAPMNSMPGAPVALAGSDLADSPAG